MMRSNERYSVSLRTSRPRNNENLRRDFRFLFSIQLRSWRVHQEPWTVCNCVHHATESESFLLFFFKQEIRQCFNVKMRNEWHSGET